MQLVVIFFLDESITIAAVVFPQKSSKASAKADVIQSSENYFVARSPRASKTMFDLNFELYDTGSSMCTFGQPFVCRGC